MHELYKNIKIKRLAYGWTQSDLAKKMGYSDKSMIAKIENGKVDLSQTKIAEFARVFGCTPSELMGWNSTPVTLIRNIDKNQEDKELEKAKELYQKYQEAPEPIRTAINNLLGLEGSL